METMEDLFIMLKPNDYVVEINLKDAYFSVPIAPKHNKSSGLGGKRNKFLVIAFVLGPARRIFCIDSKTSHKSVSKNGSEDLDISRHNTIELKQETICGRLETLIFVLDNLGVLIIWETSIHEPSQKIEYLGFLIDTMKMVISLPDEKINSIIANRRDVLRVKSVSVRELASLIGKLTSCMLAVVPAPLHYRHLQMQSAVGLLRNQNYEKQVVLGFQSRKEMVDKFVMVNKWQKSANEKEGHRTRNGMLGQGPKRQWGSGNRRRRNGI